MELSQVAWEINKIYQKQIMMEMGSHLVIITGLLYNLFTVIFFSNRTLDSKIRPITSAMIWLAVYVYKLLNITITCAKVSLEVNIWNK